MSDWGYSVGGVLFATLYDLVGERDFDKIVGGYYQRFADGGGTRDFITYASHASTSDVSAFVNDWFFTTRWTTIIGGATSIQDLTAHFRAMSVHKPSKRPETQGR